MDYLRSCYQTLSQLSTDPAALPVNIRWFFLGKQAKCYQAPTAFRSAVWLDSDISYTDEVGEFKERPRQYYNGQSPIALELLGPAVGTREQFQAGQTQSDIPLSPSDIWGIPLACLVPPAQPRCPLLFEDTTDRARALLRCAGLYQMQINGLVGLDNWAAIAYPGQLTFRFFRAATLTEPQLGLVIAPGENAVFLGGTTNETQLLGQFVTTLLGPSRDGDISGSAFFAFAANTVRSWVATLGMPTDRPLAISGYSFGAGITAVLAARWSVRHNPGIFAAVGFGGPRILSRASAVEPGKIGYVGIGNDGDPVTQLPPDLPLLLSMSPIVGVLPAAIMALYGTTQRPCRLLGFPNQLQVGTEPVVNIADLFAPLADAFLTGNFSFGSNHELLSYAFNLLTFYDGGGWPYPECWPLNDVLNLFV